MLKLGKSPARPGAVILRFADIFDATQLPTPPAVFGHEALVPDWGMLSNDKISDCVFAGAAHEHMLWTRESSGASSPATFKDAGVLADYSAVTGYNPSDPATDQGTDVQEAAAYRQKVGMLDSLGNRHKIDAYMGLSVGNFDEMLMAAYIFGAVGIGINLPSNFQEQFTAGQPWSITPGTFDVGGHYVPVVGRAPSGNVICITWGKVQEITQAFFEKNNDETIAYLCYEYLDRNKLSPESFDEAALTQFLQKIAA